jgi:hypothetical protein
MPKYSKKKFNYDPPTDLCSRLLEISFELQSMTEGAAILEQMFVDDQRKKQRHIIRSIISKLNQYDREMVDIVPEEVKFRKKNIKIEE